VRCSDTQDDDMAKKKETKKEAPKKEEKPEVKKEEPKKAEKKPLEKVSSKEEPKKEKKEEKPEEKKETKKPEKKAKKTKRKSRKKKSAPKKKVVIARGKRKKSVARATVQEGKGQVRINKILVDAFTNRYMKQLVTEPLRYLGPEANSIDINVTVEGGGAMGQIQASRTAIGKAVSMYFEDMNLRDKFMSIDKSLVVDDPRRVESKKYKGPKARARYQKSYR